jgi:hypothetical protein
MRAKFVKENMQMPFHNDGNIPIIQKYPLDNPNIIGDCAYDNKKKKKKLKIRKTNESVNEGVMQHVILGLTAAYCLYRLIKGLIKQHKYSKMTPEDSENRLSYLNWKLSVHYYRILLRYVNNYLSEGNKVEFIDTYTHYIFRLGDLTIKINKFEKTITWNYLKLEGSKWVPGSREDVRNGEYGEYEFIEPIPISQEEIDGLVEAIKEDNDIKD